MQTKQNKTSLVWFRNDLRINDNSSLSNAMNSSSQVIAVYCYDPRHFKVTQFGYQKTAVYRAKFLVETVNDLKQQLLTLNIPLLVHFNTPETIIPELIEAHNVSAIYFQKEWTKEENEVLTHLKKVIPKTVNLYSEYDQFLYHPDDLNMNIEDIPKVFTAFRKNLEKNSTVRSESTVPMLSKQDFFIQKSKENIDLSELGFSNFESHPHSAFPFEGGETEALKRLHNYIFETKKIGVYKKTRNGLIGKDFSSKFSPWLANGSLSPKTIYWQVKKFEDLQYKNDSTYWLIFELIWRDYFKYISLKHKENFFKITGILNKNYQWKKDKTQIEQWINGETKEPFVNANMIELKKTGWMSNRGRQNVASYFAKTLQLDWRIGAAYFESLLIDYDVHSNYGNWLYVSGVGNDPRDRVFNVKSQAQRYDPSGNYLKLWLQTTLF